MSQVNAYQKNFDFNHQSDIFNQKSFNRPEITYSQKVHLPNTSNRTSFNLLAWDDSKISNKENMNILQNSRNRPQINTKYHKTFQEKLYNLEPSNKISHNRGQKETLCMGDYDGEEYKIKKEKTIDYNPDLYYKIKKPNQMKIENLYGSATKRRKPAIQRTKTEDKNSNTISNEPRERKLYNIYGRKGNENPNLKVESLSIDSSTNNKYNPKFDSKQNRVNMLRSNIFNDINKEKMKVEIKKINDNEEIKVKTSEKQKEKGYGKRAKYEINPEKLPDNLDWKDSKTSLLFNSEKNKDIMKKDARQRKFKEIYGTEPSLPKERVENHFKINARNSIDLATKNMYSELNQDKVKRISENISQIQGNQFVNNSSKYKENSNRNGVEKSYEINSNNINEREIEKAFAEKGIHIYDLREEISVTGNKKDNKIIFRLKKNENDNEFENKIKEIQGDFKNNKKGDMKISLQQSKKNGDLIPNSLKWDNANSSLLTKNKNLDKTLQEKTHSKPVDNNGEKMTRIFVNLKYKNDNNNF